MAAYTGYYWIVNQIVPRGLHQTDDECMVYTTHLMDKLEQVCFDGTIRTKVDQLLNWGR